jgi:hypothetical protein
LQLQVQTQHQQRQRSIVMLPLRLRAQARLEGTKIQTSSGTLVWAQPSRSKPRLTARHAHMRHGEQPRQAERQQRRS